MNENKSNGKCRACDGCGKVATDEDRTPWSAWTSLPLHSSAAVLMGLVRPMTCPACNGSGKAVRDE